MLIKEFVTFQGKNCILGNVHNTMNYYHVKISESDLFFWFSPFGGDRFLPDIFEKLYEDKGDYDWREFIKKYINDRHPVIISINPKVLPYIKVEVGDSLMKHYINIIGINEDTAQLYISDSYIPTCIPSTHEGWIDYREISDSDIGNCWCFRADLPFYFQNNFKLDDIKRITLAFVVKRLSYFLNESGNNQNHLGLEDLQMFSKIVRKDIEGENYDGVFKLLAGIRLNIINPLEYLVNVFERCTDEYNEWIKRIRSLLNSRWKNLNTNLIMYAIAHKKLDVDKFSEQIDETVVLEQELLNDILKWMLDKVNS